ncbi:MAG: hypothetical protein RL177_1190, partial [Bacteroidota bacterium]
MPNSEQPVVQVTKASGERSHYDRDK